MKICGALSVVLACLCADGSVVAAPAPSAAGLPMSPELRQLLQAEMRELLAGTRTIAESLPAGEWDAIAASAAAMRDSYLLTKKLTPAHQAELAKLPERFRGMDDAFHSRADKVAAAAKARDAETVAFQFSRLLDTCVSCHSSYAPDRFPGLKPREDQTHHH